MFFGNRSWSARKSFGKSKKMEKSRKSDKIDRKSNKIKSTTNSENRKFSVKQIKRK